MKAKWAWIMLESPGIIIAFAIIGLVLILLNLYGCAPASGRIWVQTPSATDTMEPALSAGDMLGYTLVKD